MPSAPTAHSRALRDGHPSYLLALMLEWRRLYYTMLYQTSLDSTMFLVLYCIRFHYIVSCYARFHTILCCTKFVFLHYTNFLLFYIVLYVYYIILYYII